MKWILHINTNPSQFIKQIYIYIYLASFSDNSCPYIVFCYSNPVNNYLISTKRSHALTPALVPYTDIVADSAIPKLPSQ